MSGRGLLSLLLTANSLLLLRISSANGEVVDNCTSSPCQNNGTCTSLPGGYSCKCLRGYFGDNCENDFGAPDIVCPSDIVLDNITADTIVVSWPPATATDNSGVPPSITSIPQPGVRSPVPSSFTVTYTATDGFGNTGQCMFQITLEQLDKCVSNPCNNSGTCFIRAPNEHICTCVAQFYGDYCEIIDNCTSSPCHNNGACTRFPGGYNCTCSPGSFGDNYEIIDNCTSSPCHNNATCTRFPDGYNCTCSPGFYGDNCEIIDRCTSSPCSNNATCTRFPGGYNCTCSLGFYGDICEIIDNCTSSPCHNNGTCTRFPGGHNCTCSPGFYGDNCEIIDNCTSSPCHNNGTCTRFPSGYNCTCPSGYFGGNCEIIDNCTSSPCHNNATCTRFSGGYNCTCSPGFYGNNCEIKISFTTTISPQTPSSNEREESVVLEVQDLDSKKWNKQMEDDFKRAVAVLATDYCAGDETRWPLTPTSACPKRSSDKLVFSSDLVRILPGYPKQLSNDPLVALLAFYLQFPVSGYIVGKNVVIAMLKSNVSSIGETMNGTILSVRPSVSTIDTTEESDEESKPSTAIIIGACVGGVFLLVIIVALVLGCKRRNSFVQQSLEKSFDHKGYNNDAYFSNAYVMNSQGQATEMNKFEFYPSK